MAHTPRFEILPPQNREKKYSSGLPMGTRLGHEHDMNDALWARLDWAKKYQDLVDQNKKDAENKTKEGLQKDREARRNRFWPMLVWFQIFAVLQMLILKKLGIL
jgi:hypothetical protein